LHVEGSRVSDANKRVVREFFEGMFTDGDLDVVHEYLAADYVDHSPFASEAPGPEGFRQRMEMLRSGLAVRMTLDDLVAEGDRVAFRWTMTGKHVGEFAGIAPTGRTVSLTGLNFERVADGKIVEHWSEYDRLALIEQVSGGDGGGAAGSS
jgi:predicted ester cyclase